MYLEAGNKVEATQERIFTHHNYKLSIIHFTFSNNLWRVDRHSLHGDVTVYWHYTIHAIFRHWQQFTYAQSLCL